ncbi:MAG: competence protein CoiA family protein [Sphingomonadaceae bacterium]|nr:competence protein CoiA family protein [Sphingomonadaceae bacterium]
MRSRVAERLPGGECAQHRAAKAAFVRALRARGSAAELEAPLGGGERRADVLVHSPGRSAVAVEIQNSATSAAELMARTADYTRLGLPVLWVPVLDLARTRLRPVRPGLWAADRIALAGWIEWIEAWQEQLWIWHDGALWRAWAHRRFVANARDDHDADFTGSRHWFGLVLEGPFQPEALRIATDLRAASPDDRFTVGAGLRARLVDGRGRALMPSPAELVPFEAGARLGWTLQLLDGAGPRTNGRYRRSYPPRSTQDDRSWLSTRP